MPRFLALLVLAGVAVASLRPRRQPEPEIATPTSRNLTPADCRLLFMRSPSKALH